MHTASQKAKKKKKRSFFIIMEIRLGEVAFWLVTWVMSFFFNTWHARSADESSLEFWIRLCGFLGNYSCLFHVCKGPTGFFWILRILSIEVYWINSLFTFVLLIWVWEVFCSFTEWYSVSFCCSADGPHCPSSRSVLPILRICSHSALENA